VSSQPLNRYKADLREIQFLLFEQLNGLTHGDPREVKFGLKLLKGGDFFVNLPMSDLNPSAQG
jgi:hypothetical protein